MPVTTLDPKTALIVVDLQKGIVSLPSAHPMDGVMQVAARSPRPFAAMACRSCWSMSPAARRAGPSSRERREHLPPAGPISSPS